jgi:hypothetical protein
MRKVLLLSVPHTGTVFARRYIEDVAEFPHCRNLGAFVTKDVTRMHVNLHTVRSNRPERRGAKEDGVFKYAYENCNVVIPVRDPIDNAISCLGRGFNNLDYCIQNWQAMMDEYQCFKNVFWLDVWAPVENRATMISKLNEFLDVEPHPTYVTRFVRDWKKVNHRTTEQMVKGDRRTPFHDFRPLDFAVEWYKEKKAELDKLYAPGEGSQTGLLSQSF